jgi:hypothetical protein
VIAADSSGGRAAYLTARHGGLDGELLRLAASSEDTFDAAVSALVMAEHVDEPVNLPGASDRQAMPEGQIWHPGSQDGRPERLRTALEPSP